MFESGTGDQSRPGRRVLSRRSSLRALGAGGVGALLGWPSNTVFGEAERKLAVGSLAFPNWCQLAAATHFGWFMAEGVQETLDIRYFDSGPPVIEAAIGGNLQLMGLGAGPVINALATGALPLRILGAVDEGTPLFTLVARKGLESVADLRGKRVAVTLATNYHYFLEVALADVGMTTRDITIVDAQPNEAAMSFIAGRVDAAVPDYSDSRIIPRRREGSKVIVTGADIGKSNGLGFRVFDLWVAPQAAFESHRPAISAVVRAASRWSDYIRNPATHAAAIDFTVNWASGMSGKAVSREDVQSTMEGLRFFNAQEQKQLISDGSLATALRQQAEFLVQRNRLRRVPDFAAAIEKSIW